MGRGRSGEETERARGRGETRRRGHRARELSDNGFQAVFGSGRGAHFSSALLDRGELSAEALARRERLDAPWMKGANDPYVILVREPGCGWHTSLLPKHNELLVNIAELGLDGDGDDVRELVIDVCALLVFALRENPRNR